MSPQTPENIHQHELIGLTIEILSATDKQRIGLKGLVIDETKNLLVIEPFPTATLGQRQRIKVPKKDCIFRFTLPSGEQVDVEGWVLKGQPENRLKKSIRKRW
ncbi:MAG: ribonuclease P protein component 1 [Candidatus Heimdallarchaeota archaeon]|nr:MAG: ribonuclease P protein subunit [Candidatus Gerdarchaeota archaeon]RLI71379.1 MAG: ribonuclease P protein subunit [Candidatus Gerdarchaeota archaeon]RLI73436.1 MAG: ribonuclease P protein subunit [Candidatus Heimdallarchaeota archaeon]